MRVIKVHMFLSLLLFLMGVSCAVKTVSADGGEVTDQINITVPVSCTMEGTGMLSHTAEITNGIYESDIGTTTLNVYCNDAEGFSIYAAGFTGDEIGGVNSNKLVGTSVSSNATILTGTATSAGNPDVSNWAMKLATSSGSGIDYPLTLDNGFGSYSEVPSSYARVAHRDSGTDIGSGAEGSTLTTTYAAYISKTQPADTYSGKVKYTLLHPSSAMPVPDTLVGATVRFNEHVDVESLMELIGGGNNYNDLDFSIRVTASDIADYLGIPVSAGITTWSQLVSAIPDLLASMGATNVSSNMQILDENQDDIYMNYEGLNPFSIENGGNTTYYLYYHRTSAGTANNWSYLPASTGSISYDLDGDSYSVNSFRDLLGFVSGAWLDENYYMGNWDKDYFRTIYIYGGDDATDQDLIDWISNNAIILNTPIGGERTFKEMVMSDSNMAWDVSGAVYNAQHTPYSFSGIATINDYGVPIWTFYYTDIDDPYEMGDGFVYITEDLVISEYGIDYDAGWYFGNSRNLTQYVSVPPPTISLEGGNDLYDADFNKWLIENTE